jgi:membrane associated rhomboid family serine protease
MIAHDGTRWRVEWPKSAALVLIILNVVAYFLELVMLRAGSTWPMDLALQPAVAVHEGKVWQLVTTLFLHDPSRTGHLLFNMLWLWFVTPTLENAWGKYRVYATYAIAGLAGAVFTVLVGSLGTNVPMFENVW